MDWITINGGDVFEGTWEQLADCFGVDGEAQLIGFCIGNDMVYEIVDLEKVERVLH